MFKIFIVLLSAIIPFQLYAQDYSVTSPDGAIKCTVSLVPSLSYTVSFKGDTVIARSRMGFEFRREAPMATGFVVLGQDTRQVDSTWEPVVRSKHATIRNRFSELRLALGEKEGLRRKLVLTLRAYDDGLAFRYGLFRSEKVGSREITKELTTFTLPRQSRAWIAEYGGYASSYESEYQPHDLSYVQQTTVAALPFLVEVRKNVFAAILEAEIDNYPGMYLGLEGSKNTDWLSLGTKLSPLQGEGEDGVKVRFADKVNTPWRVIMIGSSAGRFIESEILQNLNEPCAMKDVSWIKPGMCAWDNWWSMNIKMEMPVIKSYIDLASREGWPYMLIDWQWYGVFNKAGADITRPAPQIDMPGLIAYARSENVRLWVWLYSSDVNRNNNFEDAFALYEKWGLAGIKIDFMDRDDQEMVAWYHEIVKAAARHHLMLDLHGAYKPDGMIRTYPNFVTREGVMGEEYSKFSNRINAAHNVTLAFTRMLAGQMDYTPGGFLNVRPDQFRQQTPTVVMNSRAAELAKFIIYESPLTVFSENPAHVTGQPGEDFLRQVNTTWDTIHFISGFPGESVILAKRSARTWFIGGMTGASAHAEKVDLSFLPAGRYRLTIWQDTKNTELYPSKLEKRESVVLNTGYISISMAPSGGFAAILIPI